MSGKRPIAVLLGGPSAEREVSLRSGAAVARALRNAGHFVVNVDPAPGRLDLPPGAAAAFLALHGSYGEDGGAQTDLEALGVPYTGCGPRASSLAFDKIAAKECFRAAGTPTPRHVVARSPASPWPTELRAPFVVKPSRQGSSVGLGFAANLTELQAALAAALAHDADALVEERIEGRETTVGILGGVPLPIIEVRPRAGAYDYQNKYTVGRTEYLCPAPFPASIATDIQAAALAAFAAVGGRDYGRVDVMVDSDGKPWVLEVNTLPGMTETSLFPKAAAAAGIPFQELCQRMLAMALTRAGQAGAPC